MKTIEQIAIEQRTAMVSATKGWISEHVAVEYVEKCIAAWQEQQEPFAWACWLDKDNEHLSIDARLCQYEPKSYKNRKPLYLATPPAQGEQK